MAIYTLTGHSIDEQGLFEPATMAIEHDGDGWYDAEDFGLRPRWIARPYDRKDGSGPADCVVVLTDGARQFAPAREQFDRLGMPLSA